MLVIVMHNNNDYLESVGNLAEEQGIKAVKIIERKNLGTKMVGLNASVTVVRGKAMDRYSKAFIAYVEGEPQAEKFLNALENDRVLNMENLQDSGFICMLPFGSIKDFSA